MKPTFPSGEVKKRMTAFRAVVEKRQIERLQYLGEMVVTHARSIPPEIGFNDQTGNLRSSIGYMIFQDGVAVHDFFEAVKGGSTGTETGKLLAGQIGGKYPEGIVLVVVAGMNYAVHVESKGKDVLTSAERIAIEELPKMLKALTDNINKAVS